MSYNPNIPQPSDLISDSQNDLLTNFQRLDAVYGTDHFAFSDATADATKHRRVVLSNLVAPNPAANNGVMYAETTTGQTFPKWKRDTLAEPWPFIPIKAFVTLTGNGAGANPTINQQFNITSVTVGMAPQSITFQFQMTHTLRTMTYAVLVNSRTDGVSFNVTINSPSLFTISSLSIASTGNFTSITVIEV